MGLKIVNSEYIDTLELQLAQQRGDYQKWLGEKDTEIRRLRSELAGRSVRMEPVEDILKKHRAQINNGRTPLDGLVKDLQGPLDWQGELNELLKQEEEKDDGIRSE